MILDLSLKTLHNDRSKRAKGRKSFSSVTIAFLGTGTMVDILKQVGTAD